MNLFFVTLVVLKENEKTRILLHCAELSVNCVMYNCTFLIQEQASVVF